MSPKEHETFIRRCLDLAKLGGRALLTNPQVGAVLVYQDRIIGEGWHKKYGGPHAEVNCLDSVKNEDRDLIPASTLYVSLEPCCITSKTPPCTDLILRNGIKQVVISCSDPNPKVDKSEQILAANGVKLIKGILEPEGLRLLAPFKAHLQKRPFIVLKWAQSSDGYIGKRGKQVWLSNQYSKLLTHKWRSELDAILVGHNTVVADDPELNVRLVEGEDPLRIILTRDHTSLEKYKVANDTRSTLFATASNFTEVPQSNNSFIRFDRATDSLFSLMEELYDRGILSILVEGGAATHKAFLAEDLWDEARIFKTPLSIGSGIRAASLDIAPYMVKQLGSDNVEYISRHDKC